MKKILIIGCNSGIGAALATFRPKGLFGRLYWFTTYPFHLIIFPQMVRRLASGWRLERAEK